MSNEHKTISGQKQAKPTNLITVSAGFGIFYWIMEAVRDVVGFGQENIFERIFFPDLLSLWMRLLAVCILIAFGTYAHTLQKRIHQVKKKPKNFFQANQLYFSGFGFALIYWILESIRDSFVFEKGNFFEMLLAPDQTSFWMRLLAIFIITLLSIYVHNLTNERKLFELDLNATRLKLTKDFESKYIEVESRKNELIHDMEKHLAMMQELKLLNKVLRTRAFCSEIITKGMPVETFLDSICKMLLDLDIFGLVYVGQSMNNKKVLQIKPVARATKDRKYIDILEYIPEEYEIANWPLAKAVYKKEMVIVEDLLNGPTASFWSTRVSQKGFTSLIVFPIITSQKVYGVLTLFPIPEMNPAPPIIEELKLLANDLGYAVDDQENKE